MKRKILSMAVVALIFATSCKKESSEEKTLTTIESQIETTDDVQVLETAYNDAVIKLEESKKSGDEDLIEDAQETVDKAKKAWKNAVGEVIETGTDTSEKIENTVDKIKEAKADVKAVKEDVKADIKTTVSNVKTDAKTVVNNAKTDAKEIKEEASKIVSDAKEDAKKSINNTIDKFKNK